MKKNQKKIRKETNFNSTQGVGGSFIYHIPALLNETIDGLDIKPDGVYVDVTFGGGGHSREILSRLGPNGKLLGFDQDEDAKANVPNDDRVLFIPQNFIHLI